MFWDISITHRCNIWSQLVKADQSGDLGGADIITAIDGQQIKIADEFNGYIDQHIYVGNNVILTSYRNGQTLNLKVTREKNPTIVSMI
jgi:S1-C subfamily serine protease